MHKQPTFLNNHIVKSIALHLILILHPQIALAQRCSNVTIFQEFSYADTFNSSGSALGPAHSVFQQDRFYVNQQNRLDPNDRTDDLMVTRQARSAYGEAVRRYLVAEGLSDLPAQALVGSQYVVDVEACGTQENPSIQVFSMRLGGNASPSLRKLETTNSCPGCDLRGAVLFDYVLADANLEGASLDNAIMDEISLVNANLRDASLTGALLERAYAVRANFAGANLEGANLFSAELSQANFEGSWLYGADLNGANLEQANLTDAVLRFANLSGAIMTDVILCRTMMPDGSEISKNCLP